MKAIFAFIATILVFIAAFVGSTLRNVFSCDPETTTATTAATTMTGTTITAPTTAPLLWGITVNLPGKQAQNYTNQTAAGLTTVEDLAMSFVTSKPGAVPETHEYTGVRLRDILTALGQPVDTLPAGTTLTVDTSDNRPVTYPLNLIVDDNTLLAWEADGAPISTDPPLRMCPGSSTSAGMYVKLVTAITLNLPMG